MNADAGEHPSDYIYDAFVFARLAAPDAVLFYNDFNEESDGKREAMARMAMDFNERWVDDPRNTEPDRLLVEGLGMQAHYWTDWLDPADVRLTIQRFIRAGVRIRITELDIPLGNYGNYQNRTSDPTEAELAKQAELYASLFNIFVQFAEHIDAVTVWGNHDTQSWRASGFPLMFDGYFEAKPAYWSVLEVVDPGARERYLGPEIEEPDTEPPTTSPPPTTVPPPTTSPPPATVPPPDDSGSPWLMIVLGVVVLAAGGAGAVFYVIKKKKG
jgi:endo-1,4-beta-xylanase